MEKKNAENSQKSEFRTIKAASLFTSRRLDNSKYMCVRELEETSKRADVKDPPKNKRQDGCRHIFYAVYKDGK